MSTAPTSLKRLFLRGIKWDATEQEITLREALEEIAKAGLDELKEGRYIQASGHAGASVTFTFPDGLGPTMIQETVSKMLDLMDEAEEALDNPTDDEVFAWMMQRLRAITSFRTNFNCPAL